jgi:thioredoxin 1
MWGPRRPGTLRVMSSLPSITDTTFQRDVLEADAPVLVDFTAAWCPPCRMIAPHLEALDADRDDFSVVQVDVDTEQAIAARYGILSMPTLVMFSGGQELGRVIGAQPRRRLEVQLDEMLARAAV